MTATTSPLPFFVSPDDPPARQRILVEGLRLFAEKGLCATTVRDIAQATGFTNPALYRHFAGKDELARFLFERCYRRMVLVIEKALRQAAPGELKLRAFVRAMVELYEECPPALLFVTDNLRRFWPSVSPDLQRFTLVSVAREIIAPSARPGSSDDVEARVCVLLGAHQQLFRMLYLGGLDGPPSRWIDPLTRAFAPIVPHPTRPHSS